MESMELVEDWGVKVAIATDAKHIMRNMLDMIGVCFATYVARQ